MAGWGWVARIEAWEMQFVNCAIFPSFTKLTLPPNVKGPEALSFDPRGGGPYASVADGRILKYLGLNIGFNDYATTSSLRTKQQCDGANASAASTCGRPLGNTFNFLTGELYVVDIKFGFLVVPSGGGLATQLATGFNGIPFDLPNALDIDQLNQVVYFTDSGAIFLTQNMTQIVQSGDTSGKLFKYDIKTKQITLLLSGLGGPTGVAVSQDSAYLVISEYIFSRIRKFWLRGPLAGSSEILINLQGSPDNIKRTILGDFWVAVAVMQQQPIQTSSAIGLRFNGFGNVVASVNFTSQFNGNPISEVQENFGRLYFGSLTENFVGVYGI
ncbi:hypothetical protein ACH5RR_025058 [Cinchona calisaya]|uniref:Strictosidine synthase conserved region domain-containing protein n=1 Tax=Cinchona calisaya TaxID=153742 RepID=A0ABD2YZ94_9GENT